jgi:hypothetical protein
MFGFFCQYSTGAKQLIGLVVVLIICRGGKGVSKLLGGGCTRAVTGNKIARRWQEVLVLLNLRSISHAHQ